MAIILIANVFSSSEFMQQFLVGVNYECKGGFLLNQCSVYHFNVVFPVLQKYFKGEKATLVSAVGSDPVFHKSKKRKEKKVELIDDLESKYKAKIAKSHEEAELPVTGMGAKSPIKRKKDKLQAELPVSDIGAKNPKKRRKNKSQKIDGENHVEEKKTQLYTETGKNIKIFVVWKIEEEIVKTSESNIKTNFSYDFRI